MVDVAAAVRQAGWLLWKPASQVRERWREVVGTATYQTQPPTVSGSCRTRPSPAAAAAARVSPLLAEREDRLPAFVALAVVHSLEEDLILPRYSMYRKVFLK